MTNRRMAWKRAVVLMTMGGSLFHFVGLGGFPFLGCAQARNADFVNFYQASGTAGIAAFSDGVLDDATVDSDYDTVVRAPATAFMQALWNNWASTQFPLDPGDGNVFRE